MAASAASRLEVEGLGADLVDRPNLVEREVEVAALPAEDLLDRELQLQPDDVLEHLAAQQSLVDEQPAERPPRHRDRLPCHGGIEHRGVEVPALDEQLPQPRRSGSPGRDERSFVEPEAGLFAVTLELERPGALAQMYELQDIADRDVLEAAGDRHRPLTLYPVAPGVGVRAPHRGQTSGRRSCVTEDGMRFLPHSSAWLALALLLCRLPAPAGAATPVPGARTPRRARA